MAFLLGDGALYLPSKRANEVWDVLIQNPQACDMDRDVSFNLALTLCVCVCVHVCVHVYVCVCVYT